MKDLLSAALTFAVLRVSLSFYLCISAVLSSSADSHAGPEPVSEPGRKPQGVNERVDFQLAQITAIQLNVGIDVEHAH